MIFYVSYRKISVFNRIKLIALPELKSDKTSDKIIFYVNLKSQFHNTNQQY